MKNSGNRGAAFIEAVLVIPVLLLLIAGMIDIGRWFNMHMAVSRIAYEGARYGASFPGLTRVNAPVGSGGGGVSASGTGGGSSGAVVGEYANLQLATRIIDLARAKGMNENELTVVQSARMSLPNQSQDVVYVEIVMPFRPFFAHLVPSGDWIRVVAQAPYLYRDQL